MNIIVCKNEQTNWYIGKFFSKIHLFQKSLGDPGRECRDML